MHKVELHDKHYIFDVSPKVPLGHIEKQVELKRNWPLQERHYVAEIHEKQGIWHP